MSETTNCIYVCKKSKPKNLFRNYDNVSVSFEPGINFIVGNNGTGKTNLVEAYLLFIFIKIV